MKIETVTRRAALLGCAAAAALGAASKAIAQTFPIKLMGFTGQLLRGGPISIPAYQIAYITSVQGTAVAGVATRTRLTTSLGNVPEATMRKLVDEAYADLRARFTAAGIPLTNEAETKAAVAATGVDVPATNSDITRIGPSITIGKSVKRAYAAFGAQNAPLIKGLHSPDAIAGGVMGAMSINNKLAPVAKGQKSILVMPDLIIEFGQTSASAGRDFLGREAAGVSNKLGFGISAQSQASLLTSMSDGRFTSPGMMRLAKDVGTPTPFATVATGEGAVRALSVASVTNSNYIEQDSARGDVVVVDLPVWEGLVRQAFKDFNAAIVAEFKKARG